MSWATCYNQSNNIYNNYPALMNDGRLYKEKEMIDNNLVNYLNTNNSYVYRKYLQSNADKIILKNQKNYESSKKYASEDYILKDYLTTRSAQGYSKSDLKNLYLSRLQLHNNLNLPRININN